MEDEKKFDDQHIPSKQIQNDYQPQDSEDTESDDDGCDNENQDSQLMDSEPINFSLDYETRLRSVAENPPTSSTKIDDVVIKEMDYGYLVKAGCQTLCVETKKNVITLFSEYVNNPNRVRSLHRDNNLHRLYEEADADLEENLKRRIVEIQEHDKKEVINILVIGKSLDDVRDYLRDIVPVAVKTRNGVRKYMVETQEFIMYYYAISTVDHIRGMGFNKVVETHRARENKDFHRIMEGLDSKKGLTHEGKKI